MTGQEAGEAGVLCGFAFPYFEGEVQMEDEDQRVAGRVAEAKEAALGTVVHKLAPGPEPRNPTDDSVPLQHLGKS